MKAMLTEHFSELELGVEGEDESLKANARYLCAELLEPVRAHYGKPLRVHCGYRAPQHNQAVGGKPTSYHLFEYGRAAADFDVPEIALTETFRWLRQESGLPFDKVILEYNPQGEPATVHIQIDAHNAPRRLAYVGGTGASQSYTRVEVA